MGPPRGCALAAATSGSRVLDKARPSAVTCPVVPAGVRLGARVSEGQWLAQSSMKEGTAESLPHLLLAGPRHLFPPQTFVNDVRIPDQKYVTLKLHDVIRFGYDILSWPCSLPLASVVLLSWQS